MKPFIVAEMSANHLGSFDRAIKIVEAAAWAGADAVKLQTWMPGTMCVSDYTLSDGPWAGRKLRDLYEEAWTPWEWHAPLFKRARELGLIPFSAAFDRESVDFLETLGVDRHKVASFELTDLPLIRYMASKGKPMILSTGMATEDEIEAAAEAAEGAPSLTLLRCTSAYPADATDANLATMEDYGWLDTYCFPAGKGVGISDHTIGIGVAVAATALGATMLEKHLTLSRKDGGPDAGFSMEPHEFKQLVEECRRADAAIGVVRYGPGPNESTALRRSLYVVKAMEAGEELTEENLRTARPALGLPPSEIDSILGKRVKIRIEAGTPFTRDML